VDFGCLASKCYANLIFNMERERERERERAQCLKSLAHLRSKFLFLKRASRSHAKTGDGKRCQAMDVVLACFSYINGRGFGGGGSKNSGWSGGCGFFFSVFWASFFEVFFEGCFGAPRAPIWAPVGAKRVPKRGQKVTKNVTFSKTAKTRFDW